uniref:Uncharacterized protein n=1 Tax=Anguilla anguilla TaxID=7936 RepID=A0A0E9XED3_ANGAN
MASFTKEFCKKRDIANSRDYSWGTVPPLSEPVCDIIQPSSSVKTSQSPPPMIKRAKGKKKKGKIE